MPILALLFGIMLIEVGVRNNAKPLFGQLATDAQGFLALGAAIMILAIAGSIETVRPVAKALMVLVFVVFLLKNGNKVISGLTASAAATAVDQSSGNATYNPNASPSSSGSSDAQNLSSAVNTYEKWAPVIDSFLA